MVGEWLSFGVDARGDSSICVQTTRDDDEQPGWRNNGCGFDLVLRSIVGDTFRLLYIYIFCIQLIGF